ncbi:MAG: biotin--[acetyl-CoA-carboxylase] ligase [Methylococcales bacterium]|jgi:BirA family transcriptional regulator, biotin operon repressor / biotin---[acetyl-CoA-carboxylase] ligase|nr:biotin--[acetyl-CoA-carboxylase] ligase [Methylococcales bacterium]
MHDDLHPKEISCVRADEQPNSALYSLLYLLADGKTHQKKQIKNHLKLTNDTLSKLIQSIQQLAIPCTNQLTSIQLKRPYELISSSLIQQHNTFETSKLIEKFLIFPSLDSTNDYLMQSKTSTLANICIAEMQTKGRGRQGNTWVSPFGENIYLSISQLFKNKTYCFEALSLAIGLWVTAALEKLNISGIQLKWPNDIYLNNKKLAGILVEIEQKKANNWHVIIGIGLNIRLPETYKKTIDQPVTDLHSNNKGVKISRNHLIAEILNNILPQLIQYDEFKPYYQQWNQYNHKNNQIIQIKMNQEIIEGINLGVNHKGLLQIESNGRIHTISNGVLAT